MPKVLLKNQKAFIVQSTPVKPFCEPCEAINSPNVMQPRAENGGPNVL